MSYDELCANCGARRGQHRSKGKNCPARGAKETNPANTLFIDMVFKPLPTEIQKLTAERDFYKALAEAAEDVINFSEGESGWATEYIHTFRKYQEIKSNPISSGLGHTEAVGDQEQMWKEVINEVSGGAGVTTVVKLVLKMKEKFTIIRNQKQLYAKEQG